MSGGAGAATGCFGGLIRQGRGPQGGAMTLTETAPRMSAGEIVRLKRKLAEYLQRQQDAESKATNASSFEDREAMQQIAETWRALAQETARLISDLQH